MTTRQHAIVLTLTGKALEAVATTVEEFEAIEALIATNSARAEELDREAAATYEATAPVGLGDAPRTTGRASDRQGSGMIQ